MKYVTSWERMGIEKGILKGESIFLMYLLQHKFKTIPETYQQKIMEANSKTLMKWGKRVLNSNKFEEVFSKKAKRLI